MSCYRHGHCIGDEYSLAYKSWTAMKQRCFCKTIGNYSEYGGRGISVSDDWLKFENFLRDMGDRPEGMSLERIDNEKGYYKDNCRWATRLEQCNNTRRNVFVNFNGQVKTIAEWSRISGIAYPILLTRIKKLKWSVEKAMTTPPRKMNYK